MEAICRRVSALLGHVQKLVFTPRPRQAAKLGWKTNTGERLSGNRRLNQQPTATDAGPTRLKQRPSLFSPHTIVVHSSVLAQGGQVEAFPQAVAVPYLNKRQHSTTFRQNLMGGLRRSSPPAAGRHLFPWRQPGGLGPGRVHWVTWRAEEEAGPKKSERQAVVMSVGVNESVRVRSRLSQCGPVVKVATSPGWVDGWISEWMDGWMVGYQCRN